MQYTEWCAKMMAWDKKTQKLLTLIHPMLRHETKQALGTQLRCIKSGCSEQLTEREGRELDSLFNHPTEHKSPSNPCSKYGRHNRRWKGRPGGIGSGEMILAWTPLGKVDHILLGVTKLTPGQKTDGVLLSSTDSLIKAVEDDNSLDRGLCVVPVWFKLQGRPGHCESKLI